MIAAAVGFGAAMFFCWTYLRPIYFQDMAFQIAEGQRRIVELNRRIELLDKTGKESARESAERIGRLTGELKGVRERNTELSRENLFSIDDVYPKGFRKVRIGDLTSKIWDAYPKEDVKDESETEGDWISVTTHGEMIHAVTYYFAKANGKKIVTHVLFHIGSDNEASVKAQLAEKYGDMFKLVRGVGAVLSNVHGHKLEVGSGVYHVQRES